MIGVNTAILSGSGMFAGVGGVPSSGFAGVANYMTVSLNQHVDQLFFES